MNICVTWIVYQFLRSSTKSDAEPAIAMCTFHLISTNQRGHCRYTYSWHECTFYLNFCWPLRLEVISLLWLYNLCKRLSTTEIWGCKHFLTTDNNTIYINVGWPLKIWGCKHFLTTENNTIYINVCWPLKIWGYKNFLTTENNTIYINVCRPLQIWGYKYFLTTENNTIYINVCWPLRSEVSHFRIPVRLWWALTTPPPPQPQGFQAAAMSCMRWGGEWEGGR